MILDLKTISFIAVWKSIYLTKYHFLNIEMECVDLHNLLKLLYDAIL